VSQVVTLYATFPTDFDIEALAETLLTERLIACCNNLGGIRAVYWWDGAVQKDIEVAALFKTSADKAQAAITRIAALHPYDTPCITSWPVQAGHPPYLRWVGEETRDGPR
jgi:periplasmic divalent cation tolerance protein